MKTYLIGDNVVKGAKPTLKVAGYPHNSGAADCSPWFYTLREPGAGLAQTWVKNVAVGDVIRDSTQAWEVTAISEPKNVSVDVERLKEGPDEERFVSTGVKTQQTTQQLSLKLIPAE